MSFAWSYFWPVAGASIVIGVIAGLIASHQRKQLLTKAAGAVVAFAAAAVWHGPLGGAEHFRAAVDRTARLTLDNYEMTGVTARLEQGPITRVVKLSGAADEFQHGELIRVLSTISGVSGATWSSSRRGWPLLLEGMLAALAGYMLGLLFAYLVELRRRANAQWGW